MTDWTERANCRDWKWPDEFFSPRGVGTQQLRALCNACEVNTTCLDWALRHEVYGYWAATTEDQRAEMRRRKNIPLDPINAWPDRRPPEYAPCGTAAGAKAHERKHEPACKPCSAARQLADRKAREARALRARNREQSA